MHPLLQSGSAIPKTVEPRQVTQLTILQDGELLDDIQLLFYLAFLSYLYSY